MRLIPPTTQDSPLPSLLLEAEFQTISPLLPTITVKEGKCLVSEIPQPPALGCMYSAQSKILPSERKEEGIPEASPLSSPIGLGVGRPNGGTSSCGAWWEETVPSQLNPASPH